MPNPIRLCPIHGKPGAVVFRCCLGAAGGRSTSDKKSDASRRNAQKARDAKKEKTS